MATQALKNSIEYIDKHSFTELKYDAPKDLTIAGKQFAVARLTRYFDCPSYDALVKFIESNGGTVRPDAVKSADYLIITPHPSSKTLYAYVLNDLKGKKENEKYEKAVGYRKETGTPRIIRDIDFYIANDMFSKVCNDDKRRMVMEYVKGNPLFSEKAGKTIVAHIAKKARDDAYLCSKPSVMEIANQQAAEKVKEAGQYPDEQTGTLREWRKHFSFSEVTGPSGPRLVLKKCKTLFPVIRVPAYIEGKPVVSVRTGAFKHLDDTVKEVILPHTVIMIDSHAFYHCSGLRRIVIEKETWIIDRYSFAECPQLVEIITDGINTVERKEKVSGRWFVFQKGKY